MVNVLRISPGNTRWARVVSSFVSFVRECGQTSLPRCQGILTGKQDLDAPRVAEVRLARPSEVAALAEFDRACFGSRAWPLQAWWEAVTEPGWTTVVLAAGPALLGVSALLLQPPEAFLASIAVHPAERSRGFGRCLLREAIARARAARTRRLTLEVDQVNALAIRLYRCERFVTVRRFREDGRWRLEMRRRLGTRSRP